jgi:hypothetical protein
MHYNLLFNGCSWTYGAELEGINNDTEHQRTHRFSHLVAEHFGMSYDNISKSGISNDLIVENTIKWFEDGNTCDIVIIQFTQKSRTIWYDNNGKKQNIGTKKNPSNDKTNLVSNLYYKTFYSDKFGNISGCKNLFILEQYFKNKDIKYILIELATWKESVITFDNPWGSFCENKSLKNLFDIIGGHSFMEKYKNYYCQSMNDKKKFPFLIGGHPNELGHQKIANYLIDQINQLD